MVSPRTDGKLRIAVLGCGRMGQRHAENIYRLTPRATLVAIADPAPAAHKWVKENLDGVDIHADPEEIFERGDIDAVVIATITSTHAPLAMKAMEKGMHVLLEKPIAIEVEDSKPVVEAAESHPELKVMIGFVRRFDKAFQQLHSHIQTQQAGRPFLVKSTTQDAYDPSGFFVSYAKASGGIYADCGIHDIDMSRWLLSIGQSQPSKKALSSGQTNSNGYTNGHILTNGNSNGTHSSEVKRCYGTGSIVRHPELIDQEDCDNALGIIEFSNGSKVTLHLSRTGMGGYSSVVEVFGTEQKLEVGTPASGLVNVIDGIGRRTESAPTYIDRFGEAFINEMNAFVACCLDDTPVPATPRDALQAAYIAQALTESFKQGRPIDFGDNGEPILA